jgi:hypothetical protein
MSFSQNFSVAQSTADWTNLIFTDTSTGSDGAITQRTITIVKSNNAFLTTESTDYIPWPLVDTTIDVNGLITKDYSLLITVQWLDVSGNVLYYKTNLYLFKTYSSNEVYGVIQALTANPNIVRDRLYWIDLSKAHVDLSNAVLATLYFQQIPSQWAIQRVNYLTDNQLTNF